jgi:hypothetical protein
MSLAITKIHLEQLIDDRNNGVIALSGKWGTGKSHLWRAVRTDSTNDAIKKALYVSLFGVKDILQLKMKIVQSAVPDSAAGHSVRQVVTTVWKESSKFLKTLHPGFGALDEIALLAVPAILRNRMIVIDDIERKHAALSIEEVMGFIDEFTQIHGSRILLILNSDQLEDKGMWDTLREKVIDHEIALDTTPEEAFEIAISNVPSPHARLIGESTATCEITNIRIIQKIIRVVDRLLSSRANLTDEVLRRVIPSTVLLSAIHYKGLQDGPNLGYVLKFNSMVYAMSNVGRRKPVGDETEDDRRAVKWNNLMDRLGISSSDEFEVQVAAFLKSGLLDLAKFNPLFDRYIAEKERFAVQAQVRTFFEKRMWHPECSEADLLVEATALTPNVRLLGGYEVTALSSAVAELPGGADLANRLVDDWLVDFKRHPPAELAYDNFFKQELHPAIKEEFDKLASQLNPTPTLFEASSHIVKHSGWGTPQTTALREATAATFETEIKQLSGDDLKLFIHHNIDLYINRATYESHFGDAMRNFVAACRAICYENSNPRLSRTIRLVFDGAKLASLLNVYDRPQPEEPNTPPEAVSISPSVTTNESA